MKPAPFLMLRPMSVDEALHQLAEAGDSGKLIAGGQSLIPLLNLRLVRAEVIIDIGRIESLRNISLEESGSSILRIGAGTRHYEIAESIVVAESVPLLSHAAGLIGHRAIRSRGTIGGSLAHFDSLAEYPLVLLALGARVNVQSLRGVRSIPMEDFLKSIFTTALIEDEIIIDVEVPIPLKQMGWGIAEHSRRPGDFAVAAAAALVEITDGAVSAAKIATIGHPDGPFLHDEFSRNMIGKSLDTLEVFSCAEKISESSKVISDSAFSKSARRRILRTVLVDALDDARLRSQGQK